MCVLVSPSMSMLCIVTGGIYSLCVILSLFTGPSISTSNPRTSTRQFHTMGTRLDTSCTHTEVAIRHYKSSCERVDACEPHQYRVGTLTASFHNPDLFCPIQNLTMLNAEHRRTIQLFKRMIDQFDRIKRRNAFLEQYKKEKIFENGLEEFDDARYVFFFS